MPFTLDLDLGEVIFEETGEIRKVVGYCQRCARSACAPTTYTRRDVSLVSPTGVAHLQHYDGTEFTACGLDAIGDDWWWRL